MFFNDHDPPHFHARYQGFRARVTIDNGEVIDGRLPPTVARVIKEWTILRHHALIQIGMRQVRTAGSRESQASNDD
jgi:hypothetical protein